jgi:hypothetical protein
MVNFSICNHHSILFILQKSTSHNCTWSWLNFVSEILSRTVENHCVWIKWANSRYKTIFRKPSEETHTCNPCYWGIGDWEDCGLRPVQAKFCENSLQQIKASCIGSYLSSHLFRSINGRMVVQNSQAKNMKPLQIIMKQNRQ